MEEKIKEGQEVQEKQVKQLSYEELKNIAAQWKNEAEGWKRKAYEEAGKMTRIQLLLECLRLQCGYIEFKELCFPKEGIEVMANELLSILYPPKEDKSQEPEFVPTEPVN
jgi:hypothetical protein